MERWMLIILISLKCIYLSKYYIVSHKYVQLLFVNKFKKEVMFFTCFLYYLPQNYDTMNPQKFTKGLAFSTVIEMPLGMPVSHITVHGFESHAHFGF